MHYRGLIARLCSLMCVVALALSTGFAGAADRQKVAVVNVSKVFENYAKVQDVQRRIDAIHDGKKQELEARGKALAQENQRVEQFYREAGNSEQVFDAVQALRKRQYLYEKDVNQLNEQIQKDYTREMREVLSDIRQSINQFAVANEFDMVLRSPDTDDPEVAADPKGMKDPAAGDTKTYLQRTMPKSVMEILERFNRNPVLYGARTVDITDDVLARLNIQFAKRTAPNK